MRAWQYSSTKGGLEKCLHLNTSAPVPQPSTKYHLVQVIATALNPIDYKPAEIGLISRIAIRKPAIPCIDVAGYVVRPAPGSSLKPGQIILGGAGTNMLAGGGLAEYAVVQESYLIPCPEGLDPVQASMFLVAGLTAYQSIVPHVKPGSKVFINGGSGGTGVFAIQIAKAVGCTVTTTCSGANVELCKSLGADHVIDYRKENVVEALKAIDQNFDHVVDNIGANWDLYWKCHEYTRPGAIFVVVGATISWAYIMDSLKRRLLPVFLGGGKRKSVGLFAAPKREEMEKVANWMADGTIKPVMDELFPFERAPDAFKKLKTGRAKGKIVVEVSTDGFKDA